MNTKMYVPIQLELKFTGGILGVLDLGLGGITVKDYLFLELCR